MAEALSDGTRLRILTLIAEKGALYASEISAQVGRHRSTVSRHLAKLMDAGLVQRFEGSEGFLYELTDLGRRVVEELSGSGFRPVLEVRVRSRPLTLRKILSLFFRGVALFLLVLGLAGFLVPAGVRLVSRVVWLVLFSLASALMYYLAGKIRG